MDIFNDNDYLKLKKLCLKYKIEFLSTPFDLESVDLLKNLGVKAFKIASCDITNFPLIEKIAKTNLPIFLSTGASSIIEIKKALNLINKHNRKVCIMHCTLCYPTPDKFANLSAISHLAKIFKNNIIGYSDHTLGTEIAAASIPLGARLIEKHFTYNKKLKKSADHWLSISPKELKKLRSTADKIMSSLGDGFKKVLPCELNTRKFARRSIVIKGNLKKGHIIKNKDLICKRPGTGISPIYFNKVVGKRLKNNKKDDEILKEIDIK